MEQLVNIEQPGGVEEEGEEEVLAATAATAARGDAEEVAILAVREDQDDSTVRAW